MLDVFPHLGFNLNIEGFYPSRCCDGLENYDVALFHGCVSCFGELFAVYSVCPSYEYVFTVCLASPFSASQAQDIKLFTLLSQFFSLAKLMINIENSMLWLLKEPLPMKIQYSPTQIIRVIIYNFFIFTSFEHVKTSEHLSNL